MNEEHSFDNAFEHDDGKGQEMQSGQGLWQALIIACQPAKPGRPGKTALDHPAARQEDKALLHIRQLNHLQPGADAGLVFRYSDADQTWHYFSLNNEGQYYFGWYDGASWDDLIPKTSTSASHPGQTNQLAVGASGSQFIFLINGQMVDEFVDDTLTPGTIGVGVNLPQAGEKGVVQFSNLRGLFPPP